MFKKKEKLKESIKEHENKVTLVEIFFFYLHNCVCVCVNHIIKSMGNILLIKMF